jgi:dihydroorotate dehydrogenase (fumarate)
VICLTPEVCDADQRIEEGLLEWMEKHEYESIQQMKGSMIQIRYPNPLAFERARYMKAVKRCGM